MKSVSEVLRNLLVETALSADRVDERMERLEILFRDEHITAAEHLTLATIAAGHEMIGAFDE